MNEGATMSSATRKTLYFSPWLDRATGAEYGPRTASAYAKTVAAFKDWSFRVSSPSKVARSADAACLRIYMRLEDGTLRTDVAAGEVAAYLAVVEQGHSERHAAAKLGCSRRTVRVRLQRLMERAGADG